MTTRKRILLTIAAVVLSLTGVYAQLHTLTLQPGPTDGKDAYLFSYGPDGNYGNNPEFPAVSGTCSGNLCSGRSIFQFDFTSIPTNAIVVSAKFSMWYNDHSTSQVADGGNNSFHIYRVLEPWKEDSVTWNNQPTYTADNAYAGAPSTSPKQDYSGIDLTGMVQYMVTNPANNYGFLLRLDHEEPYSYILSCSSDDTATLKRPKIVVTYMLGQSLQCVSYQPGPEKGKDAYLADLSSQVDSNWGKHEEFSAITGTCLGIVCTTRGLIQFDVSDIPANAIVVSANLSLWYNYNTTSNHIPQQGDNRFHFYPVTEPWDESTVTWNNAPPYTTAHAFAGPASDSANQDYLGLNIRDMVQDWVSNPGGNYGFLFKMDNETPYNDLVFSSSDDPDTINWPKLDICYLTGCTGECVWPGDANYDGIADNLDMLSLGMKYGQTGPVRPGATDLWLPQSCDAWADTLPSGVNNKHIDCNGDGTIDAGDTLPILENFGSLHARGGTPHAASETFPTLIPMVSKDTVHNHDQLNVTLTLGDVSHPVTNLYGIAFTLNYDLKVMDSTKTGITFGDSWLGAAADKLGIAKNFPQTGQYKIGITRINHRTRTGSGPLAVASFIITTDNINGKNDFEYRNSTFTISDITAIDSAGNVIQINSGADTSVIAYVATGVYELNELNRNISVYPNPANDKVTVNCKADFAVQEIKVTGIVGDLVLHQLNPGKHSVMDVSQLGSGTYLVEIITENGTITKRITVNR